jgi:hypothetical protein
MKKTRVKVTSTEGTVHTIDTMSMFEGMQFAMQFFFDRTRIMPQDPRVPWGTIAKIEIDSTGGNEEGQPGSAA